MRKILGISAIAAVLLLGAGGAALASTSIDNGGCGNSGASINQTDNDLIEANVLNNSLNCNDILNDINVLGIFSSQS